MSYLGEGTVVPEISLVGEAVAHEAELTLLDVLLDRVQRLLLADLDAMSVSGLSSGVVRGPSPRHRMNTDLHLRIGPAGNLDNHVEDGLLLIGIERDVVEGRDGDAILFNVDAVLEGVGCGDLASSVLAAGLGVSDGRHGGLVSLKMCSDLLGARTNFAEVGTRGSGSRRSSSDGGAGRGGLFIRRALCKKRHPKSFALDSPRSRRRK